MIELIKGNIIEAKEFGDPVITENGYIAVVNGVVAGVFSEPPAEFSGAKLADYSGRLILQGFSGVLEAAERLQQRAHESERIDCESRR